MALSDPRTIFGIHSVAPYNRTTGEFYGIAKVLDSSSIAVNSELISLTGGSQKFPWAIENGLSTAEISLSIGQYDNFLLELAYGKAPTDNAAEASGSVTTLTDKSGVIVNASTGIASISVKSGEEANLKFAKYVVKVASGTTVDVFASSDVDFARGEDVTYTNDLLKVCSALTIPDSGATVELVDGSGQSLGLEFTGGSGTIDLETAGAIGDTATFEVRPPNTDSMDVVIGGSTDTVPEIGMMIYAQQRGTGEMFEIDVYRAKLTGMPFGFSKNEFSIAEISAQAFYDSGKNGVMQLRHVIPS
jgi:hypothetical protein